MFHMCHGLRYYTVLNINIIFLLARFIYNVSCEIMCFVHFIGRGRKS